jgi:hypothetical protein
MVLRCVALAVLTVWVSGCAPRHHAATVAAPGSFATSAEACFPTVSLSAEEQALNEALLLKALDSEALYTLLADIKPVSAGFERWEIVVEAPDVAALDRARRVLTTWTCGGDLVAGAQAFALTYEGKRTVHAWVARPSTVQALVARQPSFFGALGLTPALPVGETLLVVEHAEASTRFRGYGWLFGYPEAAVDFFVQAAASQQQTGQFVERDFRSVPTFGNPSNAFVWARPKGALDSAAEREIEARALPVLERYRQLREAFIGDGKPGAVALVRHALTPAASGTSAPMAF